MILADTSDLKKSATTNMGDSIVNAALSVWAFAVHAAYDMWLFILAHPFLVSVSIFALILVIVYFRPIVKFLTEVRAELVKCSWPWDLQQKGFMKRYKELYDSTVVVSVTALMFAAFIAGWDFIISAFVRLIVSF